MNADTIFQIISADGQSDYKYLSIYINGGNGTPNTFYIDDLCQPLFGSTAFSYFNDREIIMYPNPTSDYIYFKGIIKRNNKIIDLLEKLFLVKMLLITLYMLVI